MGFEVWDYPVRSIEQRARMGWDAERQVLGVDLDALTALAHDLQYVLHVRATLVRPGDAVRIIHVVDAVTPIAKPNGGAFPGILGSVAHAGRGVTWRLPNVAVVATGQFQDVGSLLDQEEAIIDMGGPAQVFSPLAERFLLVLEFEAVPGAPNSAFAQAMRLAALKVARTMAEATSSSPPVAKTTWPDMAGRGVPSPVVHICELAPALLYGRSARGLLPTLVPEPDILDGAIVSTHYRYGGQRTPTCLYQMGGMGALAAKVGLNLLGTIVLPVAGSHVEKERNARLAAKLAVQLGAEGAIVTAEGAGNSHLDVLFAVRACEPLGIKTALAIVEIGGRQGDDLGLVDIVPEASLLISTGNREEFLELPRCERVLGGSALIDRNSGLASLDPQGSVAVPVRMMLAANNELGASHVMAADV